MNELQNRFSQLGRPKLLVIGDLMLDRCTIGEAGRISPEAPVIVLREETDEVRPGGAANVAAFVRGLDADVALIGVVGNDGDGRTLRRLLDEQQVDSEGVLTLDERPTTCKHRFAGRSSQRTPQQLLRVDREDRTAVSDEVATQLREAFDRQVGTCDAILLSDYDKGVLGAGFVRHVIDQAWRIGRPVLVDPCRGNDYAHYSGATLIAPNRVAAELVSGRSLRTPEVALTTAEELRRRLNTESVVITLDRDGLAYAAAGEQGLVPCRPRTICDVTGAGDMVLAVLGLCRATGWPLRPSLELANVAAGLEVERFGVEPVSRAEIAAELRESSADDKWIMPEQLAALGERYRRSGRTVVFTNGCFDLLHVGHVGLLQEAARLGDALIVALNSDDSVRRLKGPERPVIGEQDRARMLAALGCVEHVLIFGDDTPHRLLADLRPDLLVKGGTTGAIVGHEVVEAYGGTVRRLSAIADWSTTGLIGRCRQAPAARSVAGVVP